MPLLNSEYLSNWYTLSFDGVGTDGTRICIAESFTQAKVQEASKIRFARLAVSKSLDKQK